MKFELVALCAIPSLPPLYFIMMAGRCDMTYMSYMTYKTYKTYLVVRYAIIGGQNNR